MPFFKLIEMTRKDLDFERTKDHYWLTLWPKTDDRALFYQRIFTDLDKNWHVLSDFYDNTFGKGVPTLLELLDKADNDMTKIKAILCTAGIGHLRLSRVGMDTMDILEKESGITIHAFYKTKNNLPETNVITEVGLMFESLYCAEHAYHSRIILHGLRACAESVLAEYEFVKIRFVEEETELYKKAISTPYKEIF